MDIQIPYLNYSALLPLLIVVVTGIIVMVADLFTADKRSLGWVSLIGVILAAAVGVMQQGMPGFDPAFQNMAVTDSYAHFFNLIFLSAAALSILVALGYLGRVGLQKGEYYTLLLFSTAGMMMMAAATDLILVFLGLETMSIALYIMAAFNRNQRASGEAGIKYFLMGSFASAFFLYGAALLYGATGSTNLSAIGGVLAGGENPIAMVGLGLLLIGFAFKIAAVPFHWWTPDVYTGSPTAVTAFMSVGAKAAGFAALIRLLMVSFPPPSLSADWQAAIAVLAVLTMTLGNIAALGQKDVKRMLAYSSIAHAGYILVGVAAGNAAGISAALFYLLAYAFMNIGAFAVVGVLERKGVVGSNIKDYAGLASRNVWLAMGMAIFLLSLTGFPPLAGFWGKLYLFRAAVQSNLTWLAVIGVLNSGIAAYYYLNVIVQMYMKPAADEPSAINLTLVTQVALGVAALFTVIAGLLPGSLIEMTMRSLFG